MKKKILFKNLIFYTVSTLVVLCCLLLSFISSNYDIIITVLTGIVGGIFVVVVIIINLVFIEFTDKNLKIYDFKKKFLLKDICEQIEISKIKEIQLNFYRLSSVGIILLDEKKYKFDINNRILEGFALYMPKTQYIVNSSHNVTKKQASLLEKINVKYLEKDY